MATFKNNNPFNKTFKSSVLPTQSMPIQSKKPKSLAEMQKSNKFLLMSKKEYNLIKQGLYNKISNSNNNFAVNDYITNTLKISVAPINNDTNQISLLSSLYFDNPKWVNNAYFNYRANHL